MKYRRIGDKKSKMKNFFKKIVIAALTAEAKIVIRRYNPRIIAVTGSVGKTSAKDAIFAALKGSKKVRKSEKSYNSEFGVPLAILGCRSGWNNLLFWFYNLARGAWLASFSNSDYPEMLVLEIGADHPNDIRKITSWLKPDVAVVTRFPEVPVHIEFFGSRESVIAEKAHLVRELKQNGTFIANYDDDEVMALRSLTDARTFTFGMRLGADVLGSHPQFIMSHGERGTPIGITFRIDYKGSSIPVRIYGVLGRHHLYPALAALAVAINEGADLLSAVQALETFEAPPGRGRIIAGIKGATIIDDSYNASPVSMRATLEMLKDVPTEGRRIAVLGDMKELGIHTNEEHEKLGRFAAATLDILVTVGPFAKGIAKGALAAEMSEKNILQFDDSREAGKFLESVISEGDLILVKGSQAIRMERVTEELMAEPWRAGELLPRQEKEWLNHLQNH